MAGSGAGRGASRGYARFIGDVPGRFVFLDRADAQPEGRALLCSARSVATTRAVVTTDAAAKQGERVALRFDSIGTRHGLVERVLREGFIVNLVGDEQAVEDIDARIEWLNKKTRGRAEERRAHKRVVPKNIGALLILGADRHEDCRIKDMSASGVAVLAHVQLEIGTLLAVGAVRGRVVRQFEGGFAVRFLAVQELAELEGLLTLRTKRERLLAARRLGFSR